MIKSIRLTNFFSFRDTTVSLEQDITVLIGINGSGKTNFLRALQLLRAGIQGNLQNQVLKWGGFDSIYCKSQVPAEAAGVIGLEFVLNYEKLRAFGYQFQQDVIYSIQLQKKGSYDNYQIRESARTEGGFKYFDFMNGGGIIYERNLTPTDAPANGKTRKPGNLKRVPAPNTVAADMQEAGRFADYKSNELLLPHLNDAQRYPGATALARAMRELDLYSEFNTAEDSPMRQTTTTVGLDKLMASGSNLFQVLNTISLKSAPAFDAIETALQEINPFFHRFRPQLYGSGAFEMLLQERELQSPISALHLSDGTLRYLCLLAILLNPAASSVITLDEPDRGLHPDMLLQFVGHLEEKSKSTQCIIATHATDLLNLVSLAAVRVFEKDEHNQTQVSQYTEADFAGWYDEFYPGRIWMSGALGGKR